MSIIETPENDLSNIDQKSDMRKSCTSSVKSPSILLFFSMLEMYNRVNRTKKRLMLESYLTGIKKHTFPKRNYDNIFSEN